MPAKGRNTRKGQDWKDAIFRRDNFLCQHCRIDGKKIVAHHVVEWKKDERLRYVVDNGLTLCVSCHARHHNKDKKHLLGIKITDAAKAKMRAAKLGRKLSAEHRKKLSIAQKKIVHGEERNKKISAAKKGVKFTEEHKAKLSNAKKGYVPWNTGIPMRESSKDLLRKVNKGKTWKLDPDTGKRLWVNK